MSDEPKPPADWDAPFEKPPSFYPQDDIDAAVGPLRLIFWGAMLCVFDFSFSSTTSYNGGPPSGISIDILNDFVGMLMLTYGVFRLSNFTVSERYSSFMLIVVLCALGNCVEAFFGHFVFATPTFITLISNAFGIFTLVAIVLFTTAMRELSVAHQLNRSADSWHFTRSLVIWLWVVPLGLLKTIGIFSALGAGRFHFNLGPLGLLLLLLFVIPLIHLFMSTSRMQAEANRRRFGF